MTAVVARAAAPSAHRRRAHQRAGLAQDQASAARGQLRRHRARGARAGRGRRARARRLLRADRAARRRRADAPSSSRRLAQSIEAPLAIDSTEPTVLEAALQNYPGRAIVNSVHLEIGPRQDRLRDAARARARRGRRRADDRRKRDGQDCRTQSRGRAAHPRHRRRRVRPAGGRADLRRRSRSRSRPARPSFSTSATETIEGIRRIKRELPGVLTSLGISNVSFGLKPPRAPRSTRSFCTIASRPASIWRSCIRRRSRRTSRSTRACATLCDDLVFNRRPDALTRLIEHFETVGRVRSAAPSDERRRVRAFPSRSASTRRSCAGARTASRRRSTRRCTQRLSGRRAQRDSAAGDEGRRRSLRARRADPAVRAAVGRGDEEGRRAPRAVSREEARARRRGRSCSRPSSATCTTSARISSIRS